LLGVKNGWEGGGGAIQLFLGHILFLEHRFRFGIMNWRELLWVSEYSLQK